MFALAVLVASIGAADSVNPSTVGPALLLATGEKPGPAVAGFSAGVFVVPFAFGVLVVLGPGELLLHALPHPTPRTTHIAELVAGIALSIVAAVVWVRRELVSERFAKSGSAERERSVFLLGAGIMAVELPTAFPYFAALAAILAADASRGGRIALVAVFNLAFVSPLLFVLALRALAGKRGSGAVERMGGWLRRRAGAAVAILLALVGAAAVVVGLVGLA